MCPVLVYSSISYANLKGAANTNPATYEEGKALALAAPGAVTGYTFAGWTPSAITADMTGAQTVTANWTANRYQIVYKANGGSGETAATDCTYDMEAEIAANAFAYAGYIFKGWATEADGEVVYASGDKVTNLTSNAGGVVALYAVWEAEDVESPVIAPANGAVFKTASCTVSISCATADAAIYYTTNGRTPRPTEANLYAGSFEIAGTTTVIAFAVKGEKQSEYVEATITYVDPTPLTWKGVLDEDKLGTATTGGDADWQMEEADGAQATATPKVGDSFAVSGAIVEGDETEHASWLKVTVNGRGTLSFWWKVDCEPDPLGRFSYDYGMVETNGVVVVRKDGTTDWMQQTVTFDTDGEHEVTWTYVADGFMATKGSYAGCVWLDGLSWSPETIPDVETSPVTVRVPLYCVVDLADGTLEYLSAPPKGGFNTDEYKTTKLVLRRVDAGSFIMGEDQSDESHRVTLSETFYMGVFPITQKQWSLVMGKNPAKFLGDTHPVERVSYNMIRGELRGAWWPSVNAVDDGSFLAALRERTGLDFDLPTEAQWEYACRAGTTTTYNLGDEESDLARAGWYAANSGGTTHPVGEKTPNAWGLYDMHGNVWEWTLDWEGGLTYGTDPVGVASARYRMLRGGGYETDTVIEASSWGREESDPPGDNIKADSGFRLVMPVPADLPAMTLRVGGADGSYATIQEAIDDAVSGDTILVAPGTYDAIDTQGKDITIRSTDGAEKTKIVGMTVKGFGADEMAVVAQLMSDADYGQVYHPEDDWHPAPNDPEAKSYDIASEWVTWTPEDIPGSTLEGFAIAVSGVPSSASPDDTYFGVLGGRVKNCRFADYPSGLSNYAHVRLSVVENSLIVAGQVDDDTESVCDTLLRNCTVYTKAALNSVQMENTIVYGRSRGSGRAGVVELWEAENASCVNCVFYPRVDSEAERRYETIADPLFVDAANGDFRLQAGSPCIDKGVTAYGDTDLAGNKRVVNGTVDIGCYEYQPVVPTIADDDGASVTGDVKAGFVVTPSEGVSSVVVTIPDGVDAEKVTVVVAPDTQTVTPNGSAVRVMRGEADITDFLVIPSAVGGVVNLSAATVKEEIAKEPLDTANGAKVDFSSPSKPSLTTAPTREGLVYRLKEGATMEAMAADTAGATKVGDGSSWEPPLSVTGGTSGFYTIEVGK